MDQIPQTNKQVFPQNSALTASMFIHSLCQKTNQVHTILALVTRPQLKTAPLDLELSQKEYYLQALLELGEEVKSMSQVLYAFSEGKCVIEKYTVFLSEQGQESKINFYYRLCNKVYQMLALINLGIEYLGYEEEAEDNCNILVNLKDQLNNVVNLLETSLIKLPELYQ